MVRNCKQTVQPENLKISDEKKKKSVEEFAMEFQLIFSRKILSAQVPFTIFFPPAKNLLSIQSCDSRAARDCMRRKFHSPARSRNALISGFNDNNRDDYFMIEDKDENI